MAGLQIPEMFTQGSPEQEITQAPVLDMPKYAADLAVPDAPPLTVPPLKGPAPRTKFEALNRRDFGETLQSLAGQMGEQRKVKALKGQYEKLLGMREKGADMILTDAMQSYGKEVKEFIPPKEIFFDPKSGVFDAVEFAKRAYIGIKEYREMLTKTEEGRKKLEQSKKNIGSLRRVMGEEPTTREQALKSFTGAGDYTGEEFDKPTQDYLGALPTGFQREKAEAAQRSKADKAKELKSVEVGRIDSKIKGYESNLNTNEREIRYLENQSRKFENEIRGLSDPLKTFGQSEGEVQKQKDKLESQIIKNEKAIQKNKDKNLELEEQKETEGVLRKLYLKNDGKVSVPELRAKLEKVKREGEKETQESGPGISVEETTAVKSSPTGLSSPKSGASGIRVVNVRDK